MLHWYAMKAEASGHLKVDAELVTRLGLTEAECKIATAMG